MEVLRSNLFLEVWLYNIREQASFELIKVVFSMYFLLLQDFDRRKKITLWAGRIVNFPSNGSHHIGVFAAI